LSLSFDPIRSKRLYSDLAISLSPGPFSYLTSLFEKEVAALTGKEVERYSKEEVQKAGVLQVSDVAGAAQFNLLMDLQGKEYLLNVGFYERDTSNEGKTYLRLTHLNLLRKAPRMPETVVAWILDEDDLETSRFVRGAAQNPRTVEMLNALFTRMYEADYLDREVKERLSFFATLLKQAGYR